MVNIVLHVELLFLIDHIRKARTEPIPFIVKQDALGLGKTAQDFRIIESTVSQRRDMDSERQIKETDEQRRAREVRCLP